MSDKTKKLQSLLDAQIGKSGLLLALNGAACWSAVATAFRPAVPWRSISPLIIHSSDHYAAAIDPTEKLRYLSAE